MPAQITFYRVPRLAGLPFDPVQVTTQASPGDAPTKYSFDVDLVSDKDDRYDVYIEPQPVASCAMSIPPYFVRSQTVATTSTVWQRPPPGR